MSYSVDRFVLEAAARSFAEGRAGASVHFFTEKDISAEDPVKFPEGFDVIRVSLEYCTYKDVATEYAEAVGDDPDDIGYDRIEDLLTTVSAN